MNITSNLKKTLQEVYGESTKSYERFSELTSQFKKHFNTEEMDYFTSPGRTEIIGNHTDHNGGKILAASINMDTIGAARKNNSDFVTIISETYNQTITIDLNNLDSIPKCDGTISLLAGMFEGVKSFGFEVHGFDAYISTEVIGAAGVSSSASFEMLICSMINHFFNNNQISYIQYAKIGQFAENEFWNKKSGLMDQMACAVGGIISLDFSDTNNPSVEKIAFDFKKSDYDVVIVNTGKGHADLSLEYSEIPMEMKSVANALGGNLLSETKFDAFLKQVPELRDNNNDRALLRSLHFFEENRRVDEAVTAIRQNDMNTLLSLIKESGNSSFKWLQNCYAIANYTEQSVPLALALSELFLATIKSGCCRVHGGGFAGVIMCLVPQSETANYMEFMSRYFDADNIYPITIRSHGAIHLQA